MVHSLRGEDWIMYLLFWLGARRQFHWFVLVCSTCIVIPYCVNCNWTGVIANPLQAYRQTGRQADSTRSTTSRIASLPGYPVKEKRKEKMDPHDQHYPFLRVFTSSLSRIRIGYGDYLALFTHTQYSGNRLSSTRALGQIIVPCYRAVLPPYSVFIERTMSMEDITWAKRAEKGGKWLAETADTLAVHVYVYTARQGHNHLSLCRRYLPGVLLYVWNPSASLWIC